MRSFASVVKGENAHPNKSVNNGMHVRPAKKLPSVSKLMITIKQTTTKQPLKKIIHRNHQKKALTCHHRQDTRPSNNHSHVLLLRNLTLDYAEIVQATCRGNNNMIQKILKSFNYSDTYKVKIQKNGKMSYTIVLQLIRQLKPYHEIRLREIFAKHSYPGFLSWLGGETGWYFAPGVNDWGRRILKSLNDLQVVVKTYAPEGLLYCFPGKLKTIIWRKEQDLWRCVMNVRFFVERATTKLPDTPAARRLKRSLLQNSDDGPDCCLHWAHHDPVCTKFVPSRVFFSLSSLMLILFISLFLSLLHNKSKTITL